MACNIYSFLFVGIITILFFMLYNQRDRFIFPDGIKEEHRTCRCLPYHHKAVQGDEWGKYIRCPKNTLLADQEYWCTDDNDDCVNRACNYIV